MAVGGDQLAEHAVTVGAHRVLLQPALTFLGRDDDDFWPVFAGEADVIEDGAVSAEDCRYVRNQLNRMLQQAGVAERL